MINEINQMMNCLGEPKFDSWMKQLLVRLYLPHDRIPNSKLPVGMIKGRGWDGYYIPYPVPDSLIFTCYRTHIQWDEKLNLIPVSDGFGYPISLPKANQFFNRKRSVLQPLGKCSTVEEKY